MIKLRVHRKSTNSKKWNVDPTYIKIEGHCCYFYRDIDDVRDQEAAEAFFRQAQNTTEITPEQITTDKEPALYPAIKNVFGNATKYRDSKYMNNVIEQDHRGIKLRCSVIKGFKNIFCALKFCTAFEEIRQFFRLKNKTCAESRRIIAPKL